MTEGGGSIPLPPRPQRNKNRAPLFRPPHIRLRHLKRRAYSSFASHLRRHIASSYPLSPGCRPQPTGTMTDILRIIVIVFLLCFLLPVAVSAAFYYTRHHHVDWRAADRSSAGLLPPAAEQREAVVRIFSARTVRWRGIFATHSWIVIKEPGASAYTRYDYTAWG